MSSGPQPASMYAQPPVMLPPLRYQGADGGAAFGGYQAPGTAPAMHPTRMAALAAANSAIQAGMVRSADDMEEGEGGEAPPPAKRQKVAKLPGGALYAEEDWIALHPHTISLRVQMPLDAARPEWKLQGQVVTIPELPLTLLVSTLRDRILAATESAVPASRIRLSYQGKMLTNKESIAMSNLEDEDVLVFSVRDAKKK